MFFSNGVSIKNIVWLIEAFALCTPAVNRSRYARKADEIRIHAAVPPFFPAPFWARIVIYTEENFRGPVRTAVFLFMELDFAGNPNMEISKWIFVFKKTAAPMVRKHQKTTARFYCAFCLFHFARARPTQQMVNLCMSPDSDLSALPTFPNVPNVQWYYR